MALIVAPAASAAVSLATFSGLASPWQLGAKGLSGVFQTFNNKSLGTARSADTASAVAASSVPEIAVTKTAIPGSRVAPGGTFTFEVQVSNPSTGDPIAISSLVDNLYGDLATRPGSTCGADLGVYLAPGATGPTCKFVGDFTGPPGDQQTDTVTAQGADGSGNSATATAMATVTLQGGDETPTAAYTPSTYTPLVDETVSFDAGASSDPDGSIVDYRWVWGDGTPDGGGSTPTHAFTRPGAYTVGLVVTDSDGQMAEVSHVITAQKKFVALGDSIAAGYGLGPADGNQFAYPALVASTGWPSRHGYPGVDNLAVTQKTSGDVLKQQVPEIPANVRLATLTVGANDIHFAECMKDFFLPDVSAAANPCAVPQPFGPDSTLQIREHILALNLRKIYMAKALSHAQIYQTEYYNPFPVPSDRSPCGVFTIDAAARLFAVAPAAFLVMLVTDPRGFFAILDDAALARQRAAFFFAQRVLEDLNGTIASTASHFGNVHLVPLVFRGHDVCRGAFDQPPGPAWAFGPGLRFHADVNGIPLVDAAVAGLPYNCPYPRPLLESHFGPGAGAFTIPRIRFPPITTPLIIAPPFVVPPITIPPMGFAPATISWQFGGTTNCLPHPTQAGATAIAGLVSAEMAAYGDGAPGP